LALQSRRIFEENAMKVPFRFALVGIALSAVAGYHNAATASETKQVTRTVTVYDLKTDAPDFYAKVKAICGDQNVKLSDKAKIACANEQFPKLTKALRFRNAGIGAEFNTLAAQR
jgi:hypothetical protein